MKSVIKTVCQYSPHGQWLSRMCSFAFHLRAFLAGYVAEDVFITLQVAVSPVWETPSHFCPQWQIHWAHIYMLQKCPKYITIENRVLQDFQSSISQSIVSRRPMSVIVKRPWWEGIERSILLMVVIQRFSNSKTRWLTRSTRRLGSM